jgi:hypothetical protein
MKPVHGGYPEGVSLATYQDTPVSAPKYIFLYPDRRRVAKEVSGWGDFTQEEIISILSDSLRESCQLYHVFFFDSPTSKNKITVGYAMEVDEVSAKRYVSTWQRLTHGETTPMTWLEAEEMSLDALYYLCPDCGELTGTTSRNLGNYTRCCGMLIEPHIPPIDPIAHFAKLRIDEAPEYRLAESEATL